MQNPDDFSLLQSNDKTFTKLHLHLQVDNIPTTDWYNLRTAIEENTNVREVHIQMTKEFVEAFPLNQLLELSKAIGSLASLKYLLLGQMNGQVIDFGYIPIQAITVMLQHAGEKLLWWMLRGLVMTHIYKGSDEESEDKSGILLPTSQHRSQRESGKEKKKKDSKDKKKKKSSKKSSKKDKKMDESSKKQNYSASSGVTSISSSSCQASQALDTKQAAAKRAWEKLGDTILVLKHLKRCSLMGHFDDCLYGCSLDPLLEGLGALEELEVLMTAITRHEGRIGVDPSALGTFLDGASEQLKQVNIIYIDLTDDHIDEVASALTKKEHLEELTLSGPGPADGGSVTAESIGALLRAPYLKTLKLPELVLDDASVVAVCIALARCSNLQSLEVKCNLQSLELLALQQMLVLNQGLETLYLHLTGLGSESAALDIVTILFSNAKSKLQKLVLEGEDTNEDCKKLRKIDISEWEEVIEGFFTATTSETERTRLVTLSRVI